MVMAPKSLPGQDDSEGENWRSLVNAYKWQIKKS